MASKHRTQKQARQEAVKCPHCGLPLLNVGTVVPAAALFDVCFGRCR